MRRLMGTRKYMRDSNWNLLVSRLTIAKTNNRLEPHFESYFLNGIQKILYI